MDKNKLLYFIKDRGYQIDVFCDSIGMSRSAFYRKINNARFLVPEIWRIADLLKLTAADIDSIFFADYVS